MKKKFDELNIENDHRKKFLHYTCCIDYDKNEKLLIFYKIEKKYKNKEYNNFVDLRKI